MRGILSADPHQALGRFRLAISAATLVMLGASWPLWIDGGEIPRVPFVSSFPTLGARRSPMVPAILALAITAAAVGGAFGRKAGRGVRLAEVAAVVLGTVLVLGDQHRFQPWFYQFLMAFLFMAAGSAREGIRWNRAFVIGIYLHSGLSKLDYSFTHETGLVFLQTILRPIGLEPDAWAAPIRTAAILAMPAGEILIGLGLIFGKSRRIALLGAVAQHLALLAILGPWGLNHSLNVLLWNLALIVENVLLFGRKLDEPAETERPRVLVPLARLALVAALVMPLTERLGLWDVWPSFALYASHVERVEVFVQEDELRRMPKSLRASVAPKGAWRRLDLTAWSRAVRGTPVNPQARACLGIAEGLALGNGRPRLVLARWSGRADPWDGRRKSIEALGSGQIRKLGDRYRLNAHPAVRQGIGDASRR
jgi:hypothetical protein